MVCEGQNMINRIMTPRAAAVAFAASALFAAPALAETRQDKKPSRHVSGIQITIGNGHGLTNVRGNTQRGLTGNKRLQRRAVQACSQAVAYKAQARGYRRANLDYVQRVRQVGPNGFLVRAEFDFKGNRRHFERDITCTVRRGQVVDIQNLPRLGKYQRASYRYNR